MRGDIDVLVEGELLIHGQAGRFLQLPEGLQRNQRSTGSATPLPTLGAPSSRSSSHIL